MKEKGEASTLGDNMLVEDDGYEPLLKIEEVPKDEHEIEVTGNEQSTTEVADPQNTIPSVTVAPEPTKWPSRTWGQRAVLLLNIVTIMAALSSAVVLSYGHIRASSINRVALDNQLAAPVGAPGNRVLNILLVGSDSAANLDEDDPVRNNRKGQRLGDVIIIAHLDERSGDVALLSLPRDLWLPLGGSTASGRVNTAFAFGGPAKLVKTIEENFAIPIHHYVNVDFAGFKGLVDAVGSVDVYFDTPARDWNVGAKPPRSQTGFEVRKSGCVSLDPDQALAYVRSRYYQTKDKDGDWTTDPSSDLGRIQRQQEFVGRLLARAIEMGARNPAVLRNLVDAGLDNVTIDQDLTPKTLVDLGRTFNGFEPSELQAYQLPVAGVRTSDGDVLIPIESQLDPVLRLFAGNRFDAPATIAVKVIADDEEDELAGGLLERDLDRSGFEVVSDLRDDLPVRSTREDDSARPTGIVISHGRSDTATAEQVLTNLDEEMLALATVVQDDQMPARRITLRLVSEGDQLDVQLEADPETPRTTETSVPKVDNKQITTGGQTEAAC